MIIVTEKPSPPIKCSPLPSFPAAKTKQYTALFSSPPDDAHRSFITSNKQANKTNKASQSPFDEHEMLVCDICNAGWHMDCLLPPRLTTILIGTWNRLHSLL